MTVEPAQILAQARFEDVMALARLPYFEARENDRLALADPKIGRTIDVHTHLALAFLRPMALDLRAETPTVEHYLPMRGRPLDLDIYLNLNFSKEDLSKAKRDVAFGALTAGGMRATHTIPNLLREMADLNIVQSILLPIDWPALSDNAGAWLQAAQGEGRLVGFGSVHPYAPDLARRLDRQVALGARGIKIHPTVQLVKPDARRAKRLYRMCGQRRLVVLFHCGPVGIEPALGRWLSQVRHYEGAVAECPGTTFVFGHSGALQLDEALAIHARYPNVWLEISSQSLPGVRKILAEADPARVLFGSDWPWYHQAIPLAKVLIATEGKDALRRAVLHENAERLLAIRPPA